MPLEDYRSDPLTHQGKTFKLQDHRPFEIEGGIAEEAHWQAGTDQFSLEQYNAALTAYEAGEQFTTEITEILADIQARARNATTLHPAPLAPPA